jgi:Na+-driven multidrug efflux pump
LLVSQTGIGLYGVMVGTGCDFAVRAALYGLRVRGGRWKTKRV